jgi:DNA-binding transcriptional LysR family regulator
MTLDQLRVFIAVAERLHVTNAAKALNVSQSSASAAIATLEGRYRVRLFDRVGRRVELTEAGRVFLVRARDLVERATAAELVFSELSGLQRGSISVHASQTIANYWLPGVLYTFRRAYPKISVDLSIGRAPEVVEAVLTGMADLGFLIEGDTSEPTLARRSVPGDSVCLVARPDHPLAEAQSITRDDLVELEWITRQPSSGTRSELENALVQYGLALRDLKVVLELPSNEAMRAAVESGDGVAAISNLVVANSIAAGRLKRLAFNFRARGFHAIFHRERVQSRAVQALLEQIRKAGTS